MPLRFGRFGTAEDWLGQPHSSFRAAGKALAGIWAGAASGLGMAEWSGAKADKGGKPREGEAQAKEGTAEVHRSQREEPKAERPPEDGGGGRNKPRHDQDGDGKHGRESGGDRGGANGEGRRAESAQQTEPDRGAGRVGDGDDEPRQRDPQDAERGTGRDAGTNDAMADEGGSDDGEDGSDEETGASASAPDSLDDFDFGAGAVIAGDLDGGFAAVDSAGGLVVASTGRSAAVVTADGPVIIRDEDVADRAGEPNAATPPDAGGDNDVDFAS